MAPQTSKKVQQDSKVKLDKWIGGEEGQTSLMERLIKEMESMRKQMEKMHENMKQNLEEQMEKIRKEIAEERKDREEEKRREKEEWKKEKENIESRLEELERKNEKKEREDRRNNIVIKGTIWRREGIEEEVSKFVKEKLKIEVGVKKAYRIRIRENRDIVIASLENWEQKREVMSRKKNLGQGIWIEDDLTKEEREIQRRMRERAREEREKGNKVKVGYMKLYIGDHVFRWNEKRKKLEEERRHE